MAVRLVIADDAPFIREVVKHMLDESDIELVGEACDGEEVIVLAEKCNPDVILMDIVMPKKSGIEATKAILEKNDQQKIIAVSTVDQESMVLRALDAGCCDYVTKPFKAESLLRSIKACL